MKFLFLVLTMFSLQAFAEHDLTDIKGKDIELKAFDHAIAGSVKGFVIFGNLDEAKGLSDLTMKYDRQIIKSEFKKLENGFGGSITYTDADRNVHATNVMFHHLDREQNKLFFKINDQMVEVLIKADSFEHNHFQNPHYFVTLANGETFDFKMTQGEACYNFSAHLVMMIVGSYLHQ